MSNAAARPSAGKASLRATFARHRDSFSSSASVRDEVTAPAASISSESRTRAEGRVGSLRWARFQHATKVGWSARTAVMMTSSGTTTRGAGGDGLGPSVSRGVGSSRRGVLAIGGAAGGGGAGSGGGGDGGGGSTDGGAGDGGTMAAEPEPEPEPE